MKNRLLKKLIKEAGEQYEFFKTPSVFCKEQWIKDRHADVYLFYNNYLTRARTNVDTLEEIAALAKELYLDNLMKWTSKTDHNFKDIQFAIRFKIHYYFKNEIDKALKAKT